MSGPSESSMSDDELIARLKQEGAKPPPPHDPLLDLPVAKQVSVSKREVRPPADPACGAAGQRPAAVHGYYGVPVTQPTACEREPGHSGPHRAEFKRSRIMRRWSVFEWNG